MVSLLDFPSLFKKPLLLPFGNLTNTPYSINILNIKVHCDRGFFIRLFFIELLESLILILRLLLAEWFAFIGRKAAPNSPGSPYAIMFRPNATKSSGMKPMNVSAYSCSDTSLGCSCGDCPSSSVCSNSASTTINKANSCSIKVGSLTVREHMIMILILTMYIYLLS